jgi:hypothetical protein
LDGRIEEGIARRQSCGDQVGMPGTLRPEQREHQAGSQNIRPDEYCLTTEAVDDDAGDGTEQQDRQDLSRDEGGNGDALPGELEHQDDKGNVMEGVAEVGDELTQPEREVARAAHDVEVRAPDPAKTRS